MPTRLSHLSEAARRSSAASLAALNPYARVRMRLHWEVPVTALPRLTRRRFFSWLIALKDDGAITIAVAASRRERKIKVLTKVRQMA